MPTKTPTIANRTTTPETQPATTAAPFDGDTVGMSNVTVKHTGKYGKCSKNFQQFPLSVLK